MAIIIKQILDMAPQGAVLFGNWLTEQGLDSEELECVNEYAQLEVALN